MTERGRRMPAWVPLVLVALGVRVAAAAWVERTVAARGAGRFLVAGDAEGYWHLAGCLATGAPYAIHDPPRRVLRMPGFPLVLAASRILFGDRVLPARLVLSVLGTVGVLLVYRLGAVLFDERTARLAGWAAALSPTFAGFGVLVLSETTFAVLLTAAVLAGVHLARRVERADRVDERDAGTWGWAAGTGLLFGLATLVRPAGLPIAACAALGTWWRSGWSRRGLLAGFTLCATTFACLLPWGLRNRSVSGEFVLTTLWLGPTLVDGLRDGATGGSDMRFFEDEAPQRIGLTEAEVDRLYRDRAWEFVRENPGRTLELAVLKQARFWKPWPTADEADGNVLRIACGAMSAWLAVGAVLGIRRVLGRPGERRALGPTLGPLLCLAALHAVIVGSLRYRVPGEYPLCVLAAAGWCAACGGGGGVAGSVAHGSEVSSPAGVP
jgi:hypothetical protein